MVLCEGQGLELQIFNNPQMMIRNTNVDDTTNALPFAKHVLPAVPLSEVYLEDCVKALKR